MGEKKKRQRTQLLYRSKRFHSRWVLEDSGSSRKVLTLLDEMLGKQGTKTDKVVNFAIDDSILEERITGRWINSSSGRTYHTKFAPPKVPGVDDAN